MIKTVFLTTTLPYTNAEPHIGHALEFSQADTIVRYFRKKLGEDNVFFNVGTDEHGLKVYQKALEKGFSPKEYVDQTAQKWKDFCKTFNVSYNFFYRTSEEYHTTPAQKFWEICNKNGDIYKKKYEGLYCVGCEEFKTEKDLINSKCPIHNIIPIQYSEENYFFKLSKYKEVLLKYYAENPEALHPFTKQQELKNFIEGIDDISISRVKENLPWGVPVPNDPTQVMYVWFDALINYVASIGFGSDDEKFSKWWDNSEKDHLTIQLFGPDNLRFQCAIWQGMLASANINYTKKFICHGTVLASDGTKMSKTIGNVVSPIDLYNKFGLDPVRYYLVGIMPTFSDSAYSEIELINSYNANLSNNFGNLLNRVIHLANKMDTKLNDENSVTLSFKEKVQEHLNLIEECFVKFDLRGASENINQLSNYGNKYIDENKPWSITDKLKVEEILNNLSYLLNKVIYYYEPFVPDSCKKADEALKKRETIILFPRIEV